ncbi:MAG TPA: hypothetical protein DCS93_35055 [Microscillaceae bacterium]|nr:hypothetical protein [Microscillaceae bacterium]
MKKKHVLYIPLMSMLIGINACTSPQTIEPNQYSKITPKSNNNTDPQVNARVTSFDWRIWKVSIPIDNGGKAKSLSGSYIRNAQFSSQEKRYIKKNSDGSYRFFTEFNGITTSGIYAARKKKYCRTELRELTKSGNPTTWKMNEGKTHRMETTLRIDQINNSSRSRGIIIGQIHADENRGKGLPTVKVFWNKNKIRLEYYALKSSIRDKVRSGEMSPYEAWKDKNKKKYLDVKKVDITSVSKGTFFDLVIKINPSGSLTCIANGKSKTVYNYKTDKYPFKNYFKTGNYLIDDNQGASGQVTLKGVKVNHH